MILWYLFTVAASPSARKPTNFPLSVCLSISIVKLKKDWHARDNIFFLFRCMLFFLRDRLPSPCEEECCEENDMIDDRVRKCYCGVHDVASGRE